MQRHRGPSRRSPCAAPFVWRILLLALLLFASTATALLTRSEALRELRLKPSFTEQGLKAAYRKRSLETHPDKSGGSNDAFVRVSEAYQVLSEPTTQQQHGGPSGHGGRTQFRSDMSDAERMRMAEDMFFEMFGDLFDEDTVGATIEEYFKDVKPTFWMKVLKGGLKWVIPKVAKLMEGENTIIHVNGVAMTGKEFREMREHRRNRSKEVSDRTVKEEM